MNSETLKIKKVLLIDDSEAVNNRNAVVLKNIGHFVEIVMRTSAEEAIEYLNTNKGGDGTELPDLILLDISMPGMSGFDFLEKYVEIESVRSSSFKTVLAVVSDHLDHRNVEKSKVYKNFGVMDHIRKPIDSEDIENLIEEHF